MKPVRPLLLTSSLFALVVAMPALAQEVPVASPEPDAVPLIRIAPAEELPVEEGQDQDAPIVIEGEDGEPVGVVVEEEPEPVEAIPSVWAPVPVGSDGVSAFGHYLVGRHALSRGETGTGAVALQRAYELTPEQPRLREQAFTAAILAGDLDFAARIAPEDEASSPVIVEAGRLVKGIQTYVHQGARRANEVLRDNPVGMPHDRAAVYAQVWIAAEARDWDRALALPPADFDPISTLVARGNRARLLEIRRRYDEADSEWKDLTSHAVAGALFRQHYGEFLERRGRRDEALALYDAAIAANQADSRIREGRERVLAKGRAPRLISLRDGVAQGLRTAADQMSAQRANEFAAVYLRLTNTIEPRDQTQVMVGQALIAGGLDNIGREALAQVGREDLFLYANARAQRGLSFEKAGNDDEALAEFRIAYEAMPQEPSMAYALAAQLIKMSRYEEALEVLNGPVLNSDSQGFEVRFLRGAAYESIGQYDLAEAELWKAHETQPDNATVLNYLGYLWVDSGKRVAEGAALIARAFAAEPEDGNIQDSLGWAQFQQGQYEQALENLEQAVAKEPANAEINDHLGDAYWAVGRQREAGFQWERVLTLDVDDKRRTEVETKLQERLGRVTVPVSEAAVED